MKALTLTQPWATLVALGLKKIETRNWRTDYRGPLAIHAAKNFPNAAQYLCFQQPFRKFLIDKYSFIQGGEIYLGRHAFPLGCVIATCTLTHCLKIPETPTEFINFDPRKYGIFLVLENGMESTVMLPPSEPELSFGDYTAGRYAWLLFGIHQLPQPIPVRGQLGLWDWDAGVLSLIGQ